jgi:hypothetical protein
MAGQRPIKHQVRPSVVLVAAFLSLVVVRPQAAPGEGRDPKFTEAVAFDRTQPLTALAIGRLIRSQGLLSGPIGVRDPARVRNLSP